MNWNKKTNNLICLKENKTMFKRLDRNSSFNINNEVLRTNISNGIYTDYHVRAWLCVHSLCKSCMYVRVCVFIVDVDDVFTCVAVCSQSMWIMYACMCVSVCP